MEEEIIINTEVKGADKAEKQLKDLADATNKADKEAVEYQDTLIDTAGELEVFGVSLNGLKGGLNSAIGVIKNSVRSLGAFKTALAATGIGLIITALTGLVGWLGKTQDGMDFLSKATKVLGEVIDVVIGRAVSFAKALGNLLTLDFAGFKKNATDAFSGLGDAISDAVAAGTKMAKLLKELERGQAATNAQVAINNREISKQKLIVEDVNASLEDRIKAQKESIRLSTANLEESQKIWMQEVELFNLEIARAFEKDKNHKITTAQLQRTSELQVLGAELDTAIFEQQVEQQNKLNELLAQQSEQRIQAKVDESTRITEIETKGAIKTVGIAKETSADLTKIQKKDIDVTQQTEDFKNKIRLQSAQDGLVLASGLAGALASLAGQESEAGKALAITQATIDTFVAGVSAMAQTTGGPILKGLALATVIATGLATVSKIVSTPVPEVRVSSVSLPFARGGMVHGESHQGSNGGVHILAEGGEGIINKRSMSIPWIKEQASYLNQIGGGVPMFQSGGLVQQPPDISGLRFAELSEALQNARTVLVTSDLRAVENEQLVTKVTTTL